MSPRDLTPAAQSALWHDLDAAVTEVLQRHVQGEGLDRIAVVTEAARTLLDLGVTACAQIGATESVVAECVRRMYRADQARLTLVHGEA